MPLRPPYGVLEHFLVRGGILARDPEGAWRVIHKGPHQILVTPVREAWQVALNSLTRDGLLEPNPSAAFTGRGPAARVTVHDLTTDAVYVFADSLRMPHAFIRKEIRDDRGAYTTSQAADFHELRRAVRHATGADLTAALNSLLRGPEASTPSRATRPAQPPLLETPDPGGRPLELPDDVTATLADLGLLAPAAEPSGGALRLSPDGRSLVSDLVRGVFDPGDVRLSRRNFDERVDLIGEGIDYHPYDPGCDDRR